jgi:hypothetical protein
MRYISYFLIKHGSDFTAAISEAEQASSRRLWQGTMSLGPPALNPNKRNLPGSDGDDNSDVYGSDSPVDKRRRISEMEAVADDIAPQKHTEWDEEVKKTFPADIGYGSRPRLDLLLSVIVKNCSEMNRDYQDLGKAEEILERSPGLKEELEEAWKNTVFKRIRLLSTSPHLPRFSVNHQPLSNNRRVAP